MPVYRITLTPAQVRALNELSANEKGKSISVHSHVQLLISDAIMSAQRVPVAQSRNEEVERILSTAYAAVERARELANIEGQLLLQKAACLLRRNKDRIKTAEVRLQVPARAYQSIASSVRLNEARLRLQLAGAGLEHYEKMGPNDTVPGALVSTSQPQPQGESQ